MFVLLGLAVGFVSAIPLGPVNVFVISQALKRDFFHGLLAGLTASVLDFSYCLITILGIFEISESMAHFLPLMKVVAALLLGAISLRLIKQSKDILNFKPTEKLSGAPQRPIIGALLLYVSNPTIYAYWLGVSGMVTSHNWVKDSGWPPVLFAAACGLGAVLWYLVVVSFFSRRQDRIKPKAFSLALKILAATLIGLAVYTLSTLVF